MTEQIKTTCPYCGVGCGLILEVEDGRLTKAMPDPDHPVSRGTLCPKGATVQESVNHEERLTEPLVRRNGKLEPATWEEAYRTIADGFAKILREQGPDAIGLISSSRATTEENYLAQKFGRAVLKTNNVDNCFRICHSATAIGLKQMLGSGSMTNSIAELKEPGPKTILMVGSNAPHAHPIIWNVWMKQAVKNGTTLIVIDPRRTDAAKVANLHLAPVPGTEVLLFNAMAQHIISHNLHDPDFIEARCEGFDRFWEIAQRYTPESVAEECGLTAEQIVEAAETYAKEKPSSIVYGLGVTEHRNGTDNVQALANLALITGNFGVPSSGINALRGQNNVQGATDMCAPEWLPGYQSWDDPQVIEKFEAANGVPLPLPQGDFIYCSRMWERAINGDLKGLYAFGTDPALTEGNTEKVERALKALDLLVVQDLYPSRTSELADVVLPATSFAEKDGTYINSERRVQRVRRALPPMGNSKPDWQIFVELAQTMGYDGMNFSHPSEVFDEMSQLVPLYAGINYQRLDEQYGLQWPCPTADHPGTPYLHKGTFSSGKARLKGIKPFTPAETPDGDYPLLLTTGRTFMQYNAGTMTRRTRSGLADPVNFVQINSADAERLGIENGAKVRVSTRRGTIDVKAQLTDIRQGVIWMPFHYAEAPTNRLTNDAIDPVSGITELKACAAKLEPLSA